MPATRSDPVTITVNGSGVSGILQVPSQPTACFVFAPGAGAGLGHPFISAIAAGLCARKVATLCYQFPYMERGSRRPDPPALCHATVRAAVAAAAALAPALPLIAGGKSFGGRMTSQAQAGSALPGVHGLAFLGFPLHPANQPGDARAKHLSRVDIPMLFLQGTRDALADLTLLEPLVDRLGERATLRRMEDADHSFHVPARSGRNDAETRGELERALVDWIGQVLGLS